MPENSGEKCKDTDLMLSFTSLIEKGYLKQAETTLNSVNPELPGYEFNLALLKMLKG